MKYRIVFKSHRSSTREYVVETDEQGAAFFVEAALANAHWMIVRKERMRDGEVS